MSDKTEENQGQDAAEDTSVEAEGTEVESAEKTPEEIAQEKADKLKAAVDAKAEDIGTLRRRLTVTVPRSILDERLKEQYDEIQRERIIRGFRRGRAPRRLVEKAFGHEVNDLIKDQLVAEAYLAARDKLDLKVLGEPDVDFDKIPIPKEGDLQFSCEVEIKPPFTLPDLDGIPVRRPVIQITDEDIDEQIERFRMRMGRYEPVTDGPVKADDMVVADVKLTVGDKVIKEESNVQFAARASRVEGITFEKLGEAVVGAKVGDARTVEAVIPDDHEKEEYRGKTASLAMTVQDVKRLVLPPLDDDMAKIVGFENIAEMRTMIRGEMESRMDQEIRRGMRNQVAQYLLDKTEMEVPPSLGSRQTERVVMRRLVELQRMGLPEVEIEKRVDQLRTGAREEAMREIKLFFVLEQLAENLSIDVSEDELNGVVAQIAQSSNRRFDRVRDELINRGTLQSVYVNIRDEKVLDQLLAGAAFTDVTPGQEGASSSEAASDAT